MLEGMPGPDATRRPLHGAAHGALDQALDRAALLSAAALFAPLDAEDLLSVAEVCSVVELRAGDALCVAGELGDSLYVIAQGRVSVHLRDKVLATLGPGECVGELAALDWEPRSATVRADVATTLFCLSRDDLLDLVGNYPDLVLALAGILTARIRAAGP
jgi:CRP-like cAMP-binding protein